MIGLDLKSYPTDWEARMTLKSDTEALASIEEEAEAMLKKIGLPDDHLKKEMVICLRQIIAIARYRAGLGGTPGGVIVE